MSFTIVFNGSRKLRPAAAARIAARFIHARAIATSHLEPIIQGFASDLAEKQPCFSMSPKDIRVLTTPQQFYDNLIDMIRRARKRVFLSSLYIGSEETELIDALHSSLQNNPSLQLHIHLDHNRSTRPEAPSTAHILLPLLKDYSDRVHVSLFRSPKLKGLMAKVVPPRFNEGWGTWHAKIYGSDDDVMISGANLNKSYFTDRQDRYIYLKSQPAFANYCHSFLRTASTFSYRLLPPSPLSASSLDYLIQWPDPETHPHHIERSAERALQAFQASHLRESTLATQSSDDSVLVFPIIQGGQFNIREEEESLSLLFKHLSQPSATTSSIDLTSGYFGLYAPYQDHVLKSSLDCRIIAASPKANGFYRSRGISGRIPEGYTLLEQRFMRAVDAAKRGPPTGDEKDTGGVQLNEWERDGWTYHAKGIWLTPSCSPASSPILTLFGSTNLNSRSANLDTELSFMMLTSSESLRRQLKDEVEGLRKYGVPWKGKERHVRIGTKALVGLVGGML
ncbi:hypothetical protein JAAARDRAFT_173833 [Jaapia argillacea MUCL 33604]|uniref:CDP-diacylglycerol--glycerol-3-phosphate 3-phosphatidyltransferase n=1 Tax=Jaapia argillacea MUCL 33604 TaxID=933084 RepID=A0A067Q4Z6_9AGAM|nr:hypothetical protein JAAARDRAFT_173833 [Jaapia argillacea MUCL 33604]